MRLTLFAIFALGTAAFAQTHSPTGSYGNILHPGVPSPGALRPPAPVTRPGSVGHSATEGTASTVGTPCTSRIRFMDTASVSITSTKAPTPPSPLRRPNLPRPL